MREPIRDEMRLRHIEEACTRLIDYFPDGSIPVMDEKSMDFFGVVKNLEIIGEAAYKLSKTFIENHPQTDWSAMIGMRHIMVHGYYHVSPRIVKEIIEMEIEKLREQVILYLEELNE